MTKHQKANLDFALGELQKKRENPPDEQELADVAAILEWPKERKYLRTESGAVIRAFVILAYLRRITVTL